MKQKVVLKTVLQLHTKFLLKFSVANFTKEINQSLSKPPLKFNGNLAKLELTTLVK